jgi:hypothetical protein
MVPNMSMKSCELVNNSNPIDFAIGETDGDTVEFAITGVLHRSKTDNCLFASNVRSIKIDGKDVKVGDSFKVFDTKTGVDKLLRIKLSVADSTKKWEPREAKSLEGEAITNV